MRKEGRRNILKETPGLAVALGWLEGGEGQGTAEGTEQDAGQEP